MMSHIPTIWTEPSPPFAIPECIRVHPAHAPSASQMKHQWMTPLHTHSTKPNFATHDPFSKSGPWDENSCFFWDVHGSKFPVLVAMDRTDHLRLEHKCGNNMQMRRDNDVISLRCQFCATLWFPWRTLVYTMPPGPLLQCDKYSSVCTTTDALWIRCEHGHNAKTTGHSLVLKEWKEDNHNQQYLMIMPGGCSNRHCHGAWSRKSSGYRAPETSDSDAKGGPMISFNKKPQSVKKKASKRALEEVTSESNCVQSSEPKRQNTEQAAVQPSQIQVPQQQQQQLQTAAIPAFVTPSIPMLIANLACLPPHVLLASYMVSLRRSVTPLL